MIRRLRKVWMLTHLWLGLTLGAVFVISGLSGSLLVFDHALDEWLHPELLLTKAGESQRPLDEVLASAMEAFPQDLARGVFIESPRSPEGVWTIWCRSGDRSTEFTHVYVDPWTAEPTGRRGAGESFVGWVYDLHDQLLAGEVGATVVGLTGLAMLVSVGTGICLWWPLWKHSWRAAFAVRGGRRLNYDLHKAVGTVSTLVLLVIAFTGVYLVFPGWIKPAVKLFSSATVPVGGEPHSATPLGTARISAGHAAEIAQRVFPDGELKRLQFPSDPSGTYIARIRRPGDVRRTSGNSRVWIDQYSGEVLAIRDWNQGTAADTFFAWQFPLHNGEAFGLVGRWVVFFTGLAPGMLYSTGFMLWWRKRRARKRQSRHVETPRRARRGSLQMSRAAIAAIVLVSLLGYWGWRGSSRVSSSTAVSVSPGKAADSAADGGLTITDMVGREVTISKPVERIVLMRSLCIYELAAVLGDELGDRLVGWDSSLETGDRDAYEKFVERFPRLKDIQVLGDALRDTVSAEAVLALDPDLVIMTSSMRQRGSAGLDRLERAGIPLLYLDLSDPFRDPQKSVLLLGQVLEKEARAESVARWIDARIETVLHRLASLEAPAPRIYLEAGTQGASQYGNTFGTDPQGRAVNWGSLLAQLRCRNVAANRVSGSYGMGRIRPEYLLVTNPQVIVITGAHWSAFRDSLRLGYFAEAAEARNCLREFQSRPGWAELHAVKHGRVHGIHTRFGSHVMSFAAASQIARWLYPAELQDLDPEAQLREFHERFLPVEYNGTWMVSLQDE